MSGRSLHASVVVLCIVVVAATGVFAAYDQNAAMRSLYYCKASYCDNATSLRDWSCPPCGGVPPMDELHIVTSAYQTQVLVGKSSDNFFVVAFRGTHKLKNWLVDLNASKVPYGNEKCGGNCEVHGGFLQAYRSVSAGIMSAMSRMTKQHGKLKVLLTGHSLGAALSWLHAVDLIAAGYALESFYNFGSPRVGNDAFVNFAWKTMVRHSPGFKPYRVTHDRDPVPHLPPEFASFLHIPHEVFYKERYGLTYVNCTDSAASEDPYCADSVVAMRLGDHLRYLNVSTECTAPPPPVPTSPPSTGTPRATLLWRANFSVADRVVSHKVEAGMYVVLTMTNLIAFDLATQKQTLNANTGWNDDDYSILLATASIIVVASELAPAGYAYYGFDTKTGQQVWMRTSHNGYGFTNSDSTALVLYDIDDTGAIVASLRSYDILSGDKNDGLEYTLQWGSGGGPNGFIHRGIFAYLTSNSTMIAVDTDTMKVMWKTNAAKRTFTGSPIHVFGKYAVAPSATQKDHHVVIDVTSGNVTCDIPAGIQEVAGMAGDTVMVQKNMGSSPYFSAWNVVQCRLTFNMSLPRGMDYEYTTASGVLALVSSNKPKRVVLYNYLTGSSVFNATMPEQGVLIRFGDDDERYLVVPSEGQFTLIDGPLGVSTEVTMWPGWQYDWTNGQTLAREYDTDTYLVKGEPATGWKVTGPN